MLAAIFIKSTTVRENVPSGNFGEKRKEKAKGLLLPNIQKGKTLLKHIVF